MITYPYPAVTSTVTSATATLPDVTSTLPDSTATLPDPFTVSDATSTVFDDTSAFPDVSSAFTPTLTFPTTSTFSPFPSTSASSLSFPYASVASLSLPSTSAADLSLPSASASNISFPSTSASNITFPSTSASNISLPSTSVANISAFPTPPPAPLLPDEIVVPTFPVVPAPVPVARPLTVMFDFPSTSMVALEMNSGLRSPNSPRSSPPRVPAPHVFQYTSPSTSGTQSASESPLPSPSTSKAPSPSIAVHYRGLFPPVPVFVSGPEATAVATPHLSPGPADSQRSLSQSSPSHVLSPCADMEYTLADLDAIYRDQDSIQLPQRGARPDLDEMLQPAEILPTNLFDFSDIKDATGLPFQCTFLDNLDEDMDDPDSASSGHLVIDQRNPTPQDSEVEDNTDEMADNDN